MLRTILFSLSVVVGLLSLVGFAKGGEQGIWGGAFMLANAAWLSMWALRAGQRQTAHAELMQRRLRDGTRLADLIGCEWTAERARLEQMADLVAEDQTDLTWISGEGPRWVRQQTLRSEEWVFRVYVVGGKIKKVGIETRPW